MARAAVGLPQNITRDDPLCLDLAKVADAARTALESGDGDLAPHLAELDALITRRDDAVQAGAQPFVRQVAAHENRENALACAQDWLQKTLARTSEPAIVDFLSAHWVRLMQDACLEEGMGGTTWKEGEATIEYLLWSIQPKQCVSLNQSNLRFPSGSPEILLRWEFSSHNSRSLRFQDPQDHIHT